MVPSAYTKTYSAKTDVALHKDYDSIYKDPETERQGFSSIKNKDHQGSYRVCSTIPMHVTRHSHEMRSTTSKIKFNARQHLQRS